MTADLYSYSERHTRARLAAARDFGPVALRFLVFYPVFCSGPGGAVCSPISSRMANKFSLRT
jgi:hypothetical protein